MTPEKTVILTYCWAREYLQYHAADKARVLLNTACSWYEHCHDACEGLLQANPVVISGPGVKVEIDDIIFFKRKANKGQLRDGHG